MHKYTYLPQGVCSTKYVFDIDGDIVRSVDISDGCSGNLMGLSHLITGMKIDDVIEKLSGITCDGGDSCPNQIALALLAYKKEHQK
ncbi:MAG: TIGR03905 family TSCPD domain-containing protein [Christensenellales bacterium]|jgi:uncharacterized protein (TIGR03905 family)